MDAYNQDKQDDNKKQISIPPAEDDETPFYDDEKKEEIIKNKEPLRPPNSSGNVYPLLKNFLKEVVVLLVTVNENEIWSAINYMTPPVFTTGSLKISQTISYYNPELDALLILGMFGGHKTALIQVKMGDDARVEIENVLKLLPNAQLVAGVGVAYGRKEKTKFGDVLVATTIEWNWKYTMGQWITFVLSR